LQEALTAAPSSSDEFIVVPDHSHPVSEIYAYFTDGNNEDAFKADVSSLATQASVDTIDGIVDAIKVKTDELTFTVAGSVDATATATVDNSAIAYAVWEESQSSHTTVGTFGYNLDAQVSLAGAAGNGLYQVTVLVQDTNNNALQGARINVDGTNLTLTSSSSGIVTFNLDSGVYLLTCSPPAGYDTPSNISVIVATSDQNKEFTLTATLPTSSDVPWIG
jgi:hypothetical protein